MFAATLTVKGGVVTAVPEKMYAPLERGIGKTLHFRSQTLDFAGDGLAIGS